MRSVAAAASSSSAATSRVWSSLSPLADASAIAAPNVAHAMMEPSSTSAGDWLGPMRSGLEEPVELGLPDPDAARANPDSVQVATIDGDYYNASRR